MKNSFQLTWYQRKACIRFHETFLLRWQAKGIVLHLWDAARHVNLYKASNENNYWCTDLRAAPCTKYLQWKIRQKSKPLKSVNNFAPNVEIIQDEGKERTQCQDHSKSNATITMHVIGTLLTEERKQVWTWNWPQVMYL